MTEEERKGGEGRRKGHPTGNSQVTKAGILTVHNFRVETSLNVFLLFFLIFFQFLSVLLYLYIHFILVFGRPMILITPTSTPKMSFHTTHLLASCDFSLAPRPKADSTCRLFVCLLLVPLTVVHSCQCAGKTHSPALGLPEDSHSRWTKATAGLVCSLGG